MAHLWLGHPEQAASHLDRSRSLPAPDPRVTEDVWRDKLDWQGRVASARPREEAGSLIPIAGVAEGP
jgi:hypothetical protein